MSGCCDSRAYNDMFGPRFARHLASRYRKHGLDKTATRMVAYLVDRGLDGASVLEIGGGVGAIQLELLGQGASRTTNLELVDAYDTDATDLAEKAGLRDWMTRLENVGFRLRGKSFRTFAHPPAAMVAVAEGRGMHTEYSYRGPVWQVVGLARATTGQPVELEAP